MRFDLTKRNNQWLLLFILAFIWGASFILIKKGLRSFDMFQVASLRMFIASLILLPFALKKLKLITKKNILPLLEVAFVGNFIPAFLFTWAQMHINSSLAGILNSTTPVFAFIISVFMFRHKVGLVKYSGLFIGFCGIVGLILSKGVADFTNGNMIYTLVIILASLFYGINTNVVHEYFPEFDGLTITLLSFSLILPVATVTLFSSDLFSKFNGPQAYHDLGYIAILAIFSSSIAVLGINILLKYASAIFASSVTYIIPVFAILWGVFDGEKVAWIQIVWMMVVFSGIYLLNKNKKHHKKSNTKYCNINNLSST